MREVFTKIIEDGVPVESSSGRNREVSAAVLELTHPRARLSSTETRGKPFSCVGELCWYLAGSDSAAFISYYVQSHYKGENKGDAVSGAYGPRFFQWRGLSQIDNVIGLLRRKPSSRQAVIQLFDASDLTRSTQPPCTCTLQFFIRGNNIDLITHMRSNDAFLGLPHDLFCFTMLQEIIARSLGVEPGTYTHMVGSLHLYDKHLSKARQFLREGWQAKSEMSPMPLGDPWPAIRELLRTEKLLREKVLVDLQAFSSFDPYWADLHRLLAAFRCKKDKTYAQVASLRDAMSSNLFWPFLDKIANPG